MRVKKQRNDSNRSSKFVWADASEFFEVKPRTQQARGDGPKKSSKQGKELKEGQKRR